MSVFLSPFSQFAEQMRARLCRTEWPGTRRWWGRRRRCGARVRRCTRRLCQLCARQSSSRGVPPGGALPGPSRPGAPPPRSRCPDRLSLRGSCPGDLPEYLSESKLQSLHACRFCIAGACLCWLWGHLQEDRVSKMFLVVGCLRNDGHDPKKPNTGSCSQ